MYHSALCFMRMRLNVMCACAPARPRVLVCARMRIWWLDIWMIFGHAIIKIGIGQRCYQKRNQRYWKKSVKRIETKWIIHIAENGEWGCWVWRRMRERERVKIVKKSGKHINEMIFWKWASQHKSFSFEAT